MTFTLDVAFSIDATLPMLSPIKSAAWALEIFIFVATCFIVILAACSLETSIAFAILLIASSLAAAVAISPAWTDCGSALGTDSWAVGVTPPVVGAWATGAGDAWVAAFCTVISNPPRKSFTRSAISVSIWLKSLSTSGVATREPKVV